MNLQPVREAVSYRGLFTAGWFSVREKHCSRLKIYDRLRASEQAAFRQFNPLYSLNQSPPMTRRNESLWNLGSGMKSGPDSRLSCRTRPDVRS